MLISVCIPTYSRLEYLKETVESVLSQTYNNIELCISLDPKSDGPDVSISEWCTTIASQNSKIRFQTNERNLGLAGNWNKLVEMAYGEYLIILGDDDKLSNRYIEVIVNYIVHFNADVGFCDQYFIDGNGDINIALSEEYTKTYHRGTLPDGRLEEPIKTVLQNSIPMSSSLIKSSFLRRFPFDPKLNTPELEVFLKIATAGGSFCYFHERLAFYRVHSTSATSSGLTVHRLVSNLIEIPVPAQYELYKHEFLSNQIVVAVNRYLLEGKKSEASSLLKSKYYPANRRSYKFVQKLLIHTPKNFISLLHKILSASKNTK